jgi:hypothetical protein
MLPGGAPIHLAVRAGPEGRARRPQAARTLGDLDDVTGVRCGPVVTLPCVQCHTGRTHSGSPQKGGMLHVVPSRPVRACLGRNRVVEPRRERGSLGWIVESPWSPRAGPPRAVIARRADGAKTGTPFADDLSRSMSKPERRYRPASSERRLVVTWTRRSSWQSPTSSRSPWRRPTRRSASSPP